MARSLQEELASLKIERAESSPRYRPMPVQRRRPGIRSVLFRLFGLLIWTIPLALLAGGGFYAYREYEKVRSKPSVSVGLVQLMTSGEAEKLLSAKGYLRSRNRAMIGAKIPGRVESMNVEEGSRVKKGEILAVLEHEDFKAQLAARVASVAKARAELEEAVADLRDRERKAQRALRLLRLNAAASVEEAEQAETERAMASARVDALSASVDLLQAQVDETEESIRNMHIIAPFDGTVVEKQGEVGEIITTMAFSSSTGRSAVVTMADLSKMEVETDIAESLLSRVRIGQPAEISVSAVPNRHYRGKLRQVIPMGDRSRGTVKVTVEILDPDERLFPELVATVHFLPDSEIDNPDAGKSFLFAPKSAIFEEAGHSYMWVVDDKSRISKKRVEVVVTRDDLARVESGAEPGMSVVLSPSNTLREGETVKLAD